MIDKIYFLDFFLIPFPVIKMFISVKLIGAPSLLCSQDRLGAIKSRLEEVP